MDTFAQRILDYIEINKINAEHLQFSVSCHSVEEAAEAAGVTSDDFVKNICLLGPDRELAVAIVRGVDRVNTKKVAQLLGVKKTRMATAEEILERTGFPCGGTPSFGFKAKFLVDEQVLSMSVIYTGGGSQTSLVRSTPQDIIAANNATIADIIK